MPLLIFEADDVRRVVEHSLANAQAPLVDHYDHNTFKPVTKPVDTASVILVHDDGIYLMSNGTPRDLVEPAKGRSFVAYAQGCHPQRDVDWWHTARDLVGGDDFSECLPWAAEIKAMLDRGDRVIAIKVTETSLAIVDTPQLLH
jgi:DUF3085 family protein